MEKLAYLMGATPGGAALRDALLGPVAREIREAGGRGTEVFVADLLAEQIARYPAVGSDGYMDGIVTTWVDSLDDRARIEAPLGEVSDRLAGYLVTESVPREYAARSWPDAERSPGVCLASAFPKKAGIDDESFYRCWHGSHTPLSLRIHPLTRYVRNAVARRLTPDAPEYRAIVCESVADFEHAADPLVFYGSKQAQKQAFADIQRFADMATLQSVVMSEFLIG